jgi:RND family efflux transporter MFP subunit
MTTLPPRFVLAAAFVASAAAGCSQSPGQAPPAAAEKPRAEADLGRTTLSADAAASLGIGTEPARTGRVQARLTLTGWVVPRPGREVTVTAEAAGYVRAAGPLPVVGLPVTGDQELLRLEPVPSPVERIQMAALKRGFESELAKARESVGVAESEHRRLEELVGQKLRGQQDLEQALARLKHAQEDLRAAEYKCNLFAGPPGQPTVHLPPLTLRAPFAGTVLALHASPGQYVVAGAPLVTLADLSEPWVRVPVPENDLPRLQGRKNALVSLRGGDPAAAVEAPAVALVPQVDPAKHTADMMYELKRPPDGAALARDQMVTAQVPVAGEREEALVPYAAVVFDAYAGTWIYIDVTAGGAKERVYERRRVELGPSEGGEVAVRPPPKAGERVVTAGAAALFSREFYKPPVAAPKPPADDDD